MAYQDDLDDLSLEPQVNKQWTLPGDFGGGTHMVFSFMKSHSASQAWHRSCTGNWCSLDFAVRFPFSNWAYPKYFGSIKSPKNNTRQFSLLYDLFPGEMGTNLGQTKVEFSQGPAWETNELVWLLTEHRLEATYRSMGDHTEAMSMATFLYLQRRHLHLTCCTQYSHSLPSDYEAVCI